MPTGIIEAQRLTPTWMAQANDEDLREAAAALLREQAQERKESQLLYYRPVSDRALGIHLATESVVGIGGGNRASKTDTSLADAAICATGVIPEGLRDIYPREKLRGPINVRVICESHTTTLFPVILRKLKYSSWNGVDRPGGERGHWGWIPKWCLLKESWEESWVATQRELHVLCRNPDNLDEVLGESVFQFMSHDQDVEKFASGEFHIVVIDEPPSYEIYRENEARVMSVGGRIIVAMTWPDNPAIPVDWIFDEIYEPGTEGSSKKDPNKRWIELITTENPNIAQEAVAKMSASWTAMERAARIYGRPIRFSNRIHPLFTDLDSWWCVKCGKETVPDEQQKCWTCKYADIFLYNHVREMEPNLNWPSVFLIDPHPRKPHIMIWAQVDPADDYHVIAEAQVEGEPGDVKARIQEIEEQYKLSVGLRLMDPNMGMSPSDAKNRQLNWQQEFANAGVYCDLADDSGVGRMRINELLKPDEICEKPRLEIASRCTTAVYQMKRYTWQDDKKRGDKDIKQVAKQKHDDCPTLLKYLANAEPTFRFLKQGPMVIRPHGQRSVVGY